ncbi:MAG: hypothetical protein MMC33_000581 [Icmadophila ericetorum]|nr:hypothetical protein [Icmadophila ericetorum]
MSEMSYDPIIYDSDEESQAIRIGLAHSRSRPQPAPHELNSSQAPTNNNYDFPFLEPEPEPELPLYNPLDYGLYDSYQDYDNILDVEDRRIGTPTYNNDDEEVPGLTPNTLPPYRSDVDANSLPFFFFLIPPTSTKRARSEGGGTRTRDADLQSAGSEYLSKPYHSLAAAAANYRHDNRERIDDFDYPELGLNKLGQWSILNWDGEIRDPMYEDGVKVWYKDLGEGWDGKQEREME